MPDPLFQLRKIIESYGGTMTQFELPSYLTASDIANWKLRSQTVYPQLWADPRFQRLYTDYEKRIMRIHKQNREDEDREIEMAEEENPHYQKEELANWKRIKKEHPSAIVRSRSTPVGIARLAIWGPKGDKKVMPISFLRKTQQHNPSSQGSHNAFIQNKLRDYDNNFTTDELRSMLYQLGQGRSRAKRATLIRRLAEIDWSEYQSSQNYLASLNIPNEDGSRREMLDNPSIPSIFVSLLTLAGIALFFRQN